jgi:phosphate-selective porin OprO/OprP
MTSRRFLGALAALTAAAAFVMFPRSLDAQTPAPPPASTPAPAQPAPAPPPVAGWQDGFFVQTPNGDNRLVLGLTTQMDGRFSLDDPKATINTFTIRKARPTLSGRVAKYFDFKVMPEFGNGTTTILDAYVDIRFSPKFRLRTGKDKTPVGYELLIGDGNLFFPERTFVSSLVPNRDIGVQVQGDVVGGKIFYAGGVFNGVPDGTSSTVDLDPNSGKELAGRIVVQPFRRTGTGGTPAGAASGFGFQVGGSNGQQVGALPTLRTSVGQTYFSYASTATANGVRNRVTPALFYFYKSFGAFAEYARSSQAVSRAGLTTDVTNEAWGVTGSIFLTGETASIGVTRPRNNFDPPNRHGGALQIVARYSAIKVDEAAFAAGLAAAGASREAKLVTVGTNWYPVPYIKYYVTYERTIFDRNAAGARPPENVILFRTQLAF